MDKCYVMDMLTVLYYALRQEAEVVAILLGRPYQRGAQCLGRLLDPKASKSTMSSLADRLYSIATVGISMISIPARSSQGSHSKYGHSK